MIKLIVVLFALAFCGGLAYLAYHTFCYTNRLLDNTEMDNYDRKVEIIGSLVIGGLLISMLIGTIKGIV